MIIVGRFRRVQCRCSRATCRARKTLPKPPEEYQRPPKCAECGGKMVVDQHRSARPRREKFLMQKPCRCEGYGWDSAGNPVPHRRGSKYCEAGTAGMEARYNERAGYNAAP